MTLMIIFSAVALTALIASFASVLFAIHTAIELKAMQKSTHQIQLVPADSLTSGTGINDDPFEPITRQTYERDNAHLAENL